MPFWTQILCQPCKFPQNLTPNFLRQLCLLSHRSHCRQLHGWKNAATVATAICISSLQFLFLSKAGKPQFQFHFPSLPCFSPSFSFNWFTTQVEKRLKLDHPSQQGILHPPPPFPLETNSSSSAGESLSTPLYLHFSQTDTSSALQESSEPPLEFLSNSSQTPPSHPQSESNPRNPIDHGQNRGLDHIQRLIQLLGLGDSRDEKELGTKSGCNGCEGCESGFYSKIVGLKGPKCRKEVERLNGWIEFFWNGGGEEERLEPLRLAYLLLGKAVFASNEGDGCLEGLEFPSTVEDFLLNDPPPW